MIKENKICFTAWKNYNDIEKNESRIVYAESVLFNGVALEECRNIGDYIQSMIDNGVSYVYVYDLYVFGYFLIDYCKKNNYVFYDEIKDEKKTKIQCCCFDFFAGENGFYNFIINQPRKRYTKNMRGGTIGAYRKVEWRGLSPLIGEGNKEEVYRDFCHDDEERESESIRKCFTDIYHFYKEKMNCDLLDEYKMRKTYTTGNVAQNYYLYLKYGDGYNLKKYQNEFLQVEQDEDDLREKKLLLGGMNFFPTRRKNGKLLKAKNIIKYDCNSLYPYIAENVKVPRGEIESISKSEYGKEEKKYIYFTIVRDLVLERKPHAVPCFGNPFENGIENQDHIEITNDFAIFLELFEELKNFYDIDYDCLTVLGYFRVSADYRDNSIKEYNNKLKKIKYETKNTNPSFYELSKICLNSILGKFSQNHKYKTYVLDYDKTEQYYFLRKDANVVNNWEKKHFHFIRGAYIYAMARVYMMRIIKENGINDITHIYTDTDSIICRQELNGDLIDGKEFGKFKVEGKPVAVGVVGKKQYFTVDEQGKMEMTCAGIKKGEVIKQVKNDGYITPDDIFSEIAGKRLFTRNYWIPSKGGAKVVLEKIRLRDIEKEIKTIWEE